MKYFLLKFLSFLFISICLVTGAGLNLNSAFDEVLSALSPIKGHQSSGDSSFFVSSPGFTSPHFLGSLKFELEDGGNNKENLDSTNVLSEFQLDEGFGGVSLEGITLDDTDHSTSNSWSDSDDEEPSQTLSIFEKLSTPKKTKLDEYLTKREIALLTVLSNTFIQRDNDASAIDTSANDLRIYYNEGGSPEELSHYSESFKISEIQLFKNPKNEGVIATPFLRALTTDRVTIRRLIEDEIAKSRHFFQDDEAPLDPKPILEKMRYLPIEEELAVYEAYACILDTYKELKDCITRKSIESLFLEKVVSRGFKRLDTDIYNFFYCLGYIDIDKSIEALSLGKNPINIHGEVMHFHHVTQQDGYYDPAYMVLMSASIHKELHAGIHFDNTNKFRHRLVERSVYSAKRVKVCETLLEVLIGVKESKSTRKIIKAKRFGRSVLKDCTNQIWVTEGSTNIRSDIDGEFGVVDAGENSKVNAPQKTKRENKNLDNDGSDSNPFAKSKMSPALLSYVDFDEED